MSKANFDEYDKRKANEEKLPAITQAALGAFEIIVGAEINLKALDRVSSYLRSPHSHRVEDEISTALGTIRRAIKFQELDGYQRLMMWGLLGTPEVTNLARQAATKRFLIGNHLTNYIDPDDYSSDEVEAKFREEIRKVTGIDVTKKIDENEED